MRAFAARLEAEASIPEPEAIGEASRALPGTKGKRRAWVIGVAAVIFVGVVGAFVWQNTHEEAVLDFPSGPRLAVMPFENLGEEEEQYFSEGLTEDLITTLSRFADMVVFPRQTTSQLSKEGASCREIGDALNADFILYGTLRRSDKSLRVTTKLLDAKDCAQLWSENYDGSLTAEDVYSVQDDIISQVAGSVGSSDAALWNWKKQQELQGKRADSLESYECVLTAVWWPQSFSEETHKRAKDCLERVVEVDPNYSAAQAELAWIYINSHKYNYKHKPPNALELALSRIQKAIELNPRSTRAYWALAIHRYLTEPDFDAFLTAAEQAIAINPNASIMVGDLGTWLAYSGQWERGRELLELEKAIRLNPRHPRWFLWIICLNHYRQSEFQDARACVLNMNLPNNQIIHT